VAAGAGGAYGKLVDLFATSATGAAAQALRQRRQEQEGDSEGDSEVRDGGITAAGRRSDAFLCAALGDIAPTYHQACGLAGAHS
jgi:hypothetical protein